MPTAIEFNHVGKQYRLGLVSTGTLSHDLNRWWQTAVLRREDPYLKIGSVNDRTKAADSDYVWALRDIDFKVEQGDVVGIIGKNGAGKSTLLKLLSKVTTPTTGIIRARGRIASLLEVGTGFHGEMTGRENIYMNGAIMGMTRKEISAKLDEIVDFSGCERYLDTPVKRYSSGMTVRLGFAVAAHLDPEILVVDEVLAVGDAEFQKKAIGKMHDISHTHGRTVLFVSHNMASIRQLCTKAVLLDNGLVELIGGVEDCIERYISNKDKKEFISNVIITDKHREKYELLTHDIDFISVEMLNEKLDAIATDEPLKFRVGMKINSRRSQMFQLCVFIQNSTDVRVLFCMTDTMSIPERQDTFYIDITIPSHNLPKGLYSVRLEANYQDFNVGSVHFDFIHHVLFFEVKYIHKELQDEYLFWSSNFGEILQLGSPYINAKLYCG